LPANEWPCGLDLGRTGTGRRPLSPGCRDQRDASRHKAEHQGKGHLPPGRQHGAGHSFRQRRDLLRCTSQRTLHRGTQQGARQDRLPRTLGQERGEQRRGDGQTAPSQPSAQSLARFLQPALQGAGGPTELPGGLVALDGETLHQSPVGNSGNVLRCYRPAEVAEKGLWMSGSHVRSRESCLLLSE
jgi:hypothetical protein